MRIPEIDASVQKFFARAFMIDFEEERNLLGIKTRRKRMVRQREEE